MTVPSSASRSFCEYTTEATACKRTVVPSNRIGKTRFQNSSQDDLKSA